MRSITQRRLVSQNTGFPVVAPNKDPLLDLIPEENSAEPKADKKNGSKKDVVQRVNSQLNKDFLKKIMGNMNPEDLKNADKVKKMVKGGK